MKMGRKTPVSDSQIASQIDAGKTDALISRQLHVGRNRVAKIRKLPTCSNLETPIEAVRAAVRLELNQEETLNEFSDQLAEYTKNYKLAMEQKDEDGVNVPDLDGAGKWAFLRLRLLEHMIKISGLSARRPEEPPPTTQDALNAMTDEEVEARARAILARRQ